MEWDEMDCTRLDWVSKENNSDGQTWLPWIEPRGVEPPFLHAAATAVAPPPPSADRQQVRQTTMQT